MRERTDARLGIIGRDSGKSQSRQLLLKPRRQLVSVGVDAADAQLLDESEGFELTGVVERRFLRSAAKRALRQRE